MKFLAFISATLFSLSAHATIVEKECVPRDQDMKRFVEVGNTLRAKIRVSSYPGIREAWKIMLERDFDIMHTEVVFDVLLNTDGVVILIAGREDCVSHRTIVTADQFRKLVGRIS